MFDRSDLATLLIAWVAGVGAVGSYWLVGLFWCVGLFALTGVGVFVWGVFRLRSEAMVSAAQLADGMFKDLAKQLKKGD